MLPSEIEALLRAEQEASQVVRGVDFDEYIDKIGEKAEILALYENGCRGFVAYYCNNLETKAGFITMVVVHPQCRGQGIAKSLIGAVLDIMRGRGFVTCSMEVHETNTAAQELYRALGFRLSSKKAESFILNMDL